MKSETSITDIFSGPLPANRISMTPEHECQECNHHPADALVPSALSKKKNKERTANEDRAAKWINPDEGKRGTVAEAFEQHFVDVPWNGVKRKQPMLVPGLPEHVGNAGVSKIQEGIKSREIICRGQDSKR